MNAPARHTHNVTQVVHQGVYSALGNMSAEGELVVFALHSGGNEASQQYGISDPDYDGDMPDASALSGVSRGLITDTDAFVSSFDPECYLDNSRKVVLVEPIPMIQQHSAICEAMSEHKQKEIIHELPSGLAALIALGRTSGIAVDVGTDLLQCQIFFEGYDMQQAVLMQRAVQPVHDVQCKQVGSSDFELPDGAIVPTMNLIRECKSSLPPGLTYKWDPDALDAFKSNKQDATMGRLPGTSTAIFTGLGLPHYDQNYDKNEEMLLWRSSMGSENQRAICPPERAFTAYMRGQIYNQLYTGNQRGGRTLS